MQHGSGETQLIDQLGTALMRASGILSALSACQDPARGTFAVPGPFLVQAITALEGFVNDARTAYIDLCAAREQREAKTPLQHAPQRPLVPPVAEPADPAVFVTSEPVAAPHELPGFYQLRHHDLQNLSLASSLDQDGFAQSYDALLRKLTAAEVFAAESNRISDEQNSPLLPLLKSLRHDLERIRAA